MCANDSLMMAVRESKRAVKLILADFGKCLYVGLPECSSVCVTKRMQHADEHNTASTAYCPLLLASSAHNSNYRLVRLTNKTTVWHKQEDASYKSNTAHCCLLLASSALSHNYRLVRLTNKKRRLRSLACVWMCR
jgi:formate hydrogenlyase subunit 6/NADH:ubiquinone oxidoreductase subunit I